MRNGNDDMDDAQLKDSLRINREASDPSRIYWDKNNPYFDEELTKRVANGDLRIHFNDRNTSFSYKGRSVFVQYIGIFFDKNTYVEYIQTLDKGIPMVEISYDYIPYKGRSVMCTYVFILWSKKRSVADKDSLVFHEFRPRIYALSSPKVGTEIMHALYVKDPERVVLSRFDNSNKYFQPSLKETQSGDAQRDILQLPLRNPVSDEQKIDIPRSPDIKALDNANEFNKLIESPIPTPDLINFDGFCNGLSPQIGIKVAPVHEDKEAMPDAIANMNLKPPLYIARPNTLIERDRVFREMNQICPNLLQTIDILFPMDTDNKRAFCTEIVMAACAKLGGGMTPNKLGALKLALVKKYDVVEIVVLKEFRRFFEPERFNL